jgi:hypothetical protein
MPNPNKTRELIGAGVFAAAFIAVVCYLTFV